MSRRSPLHSTSCCSQWYPLTSLFKPYILQLHSAMFPLSLIAMTWSFTVLFSFSYTFILFSFFHFYLRVVMAPVPPCYLISLHFQPPVLPFFIFLYSIKSTSLVSSCLGGLTAPLAIFLLMPKRPHSNLHNYVKSYLPTWPYCPAYYRGQ